MFIYPEQEITYIAGAHSIKDEEAKPALEVLSAIVELWETKFGTTERRPGRDVLYYDMAFRENTNDYFDSQAFRMRPWRSDDVLHWNFIWRDIAVSWYKRFGRDTYISRVPSAEELVQMKEEIFKEILGIDIEMVMAGKYPTLAELTDRLNHNLRFDNLTKARDKPQYGPNSAYGRSEEYMATNTPNSAGTNIVSSLQTDTIWNGLKKELAAHTGASFPPNLFIGNKN